MQTKRKHLIETLKIKQDEGWRGGEKIQTTVTEQQ